jgi:hypothetical protein
VANPHEIVWMGIIAEGWWKISRQRIHLVENFDQDLGRQHINWAGGVLVDFQSSCDMCQFRLKLFYLHSEHRFPVLRFQDLVVLTSATTEERLLLPNGQSQHELYDQFLLQAVP